jgi:hypothetical protein
MRPNRTYISYVVQRRDGHEHYGEIVALPTPEVALYTDNTTEEVVRWVEAKQQKVGSDGTVVILNFFNVKN